MAPSDAGVSTKTNRSFLANFLLFDGFATGLPCIAFGMLGYRLGPVIGISGRYASVKFGMLAVYGCSLAYSMLGQRKASFTHVLCAAAANIAFAAETVHAYYTGRLDGLTWLGKLMMSSLAGGGLAFPIVMWQGYIQQQAKTE